MKKIITTIAAIIVLTSCQKKELNVGDKYLHSFYWDNENPFEVRDIDTASILDIKDGYVKFRLSYGKDGGFVITSSKIRSFLRRIKDLPKTNVSDPYNKIDTLNTTCTFSSSPSYTLSDAAGNKTVVTKSK